MLNRRDFIKNTALGLLAVGVLPSEVFAANVKADMVIFGNFYTVDEKKRKPKQWRLRTANIFTSARRQA